MDIVDTHLHCWDRDRFRYDWLTDTDFPWRFTPQDAPVPAGGVDRFRAVFMEADRTADQALAEARWALSLGADPSTGPQIVAAVAHAPLGDGAVRELDALHAEAGVVGIRRLLQDEPVAAFADQVLRADLEQVGARGLVFDACVRAHQLGALAELAAAVPMTTIVLDHLGKPEVDDPRSAGHGEWRSGIAALAARENVVVKLSGLVPSAGSFAAVRPWVQACLDAFGPGRTVLGSDWPVSRQDGVPYPAWFAFVLDDCGLGSDEREVVAHGNAELLYHLSA